MAVSSYIFKNKLANFIKNVIKSLRFDGVNDYVISTQNLNIERTQAWTFFARYKGLNWSGANRNTFFSNALDGSSAGISIGQVTGISNQLLVVLRNTATTNDLVARFANANTFDVDGIVQITYDGSSLLSGIRLYINNVEKTTRGAPEIQNLTASIVSSGQKAKIGRYISTIQNLFTADSKIQEVSLVNYVKSAPELSEDVANGFQSKGSGDFLFRQSFNVAGNPLALKADVLGGSQIDMSIIGQVTGDFVDF